MLEYSISYGWLNTSYNVLQYSAMFGSLVYLNEIVLVNSRQIYNLWQNFWANYFINLKEKRPNLGLCSAYLYYL